MIKAIHFGEHLGEELKEMGMSAAEFSRQIGFADQSDYADSQRPPIDHWRHSFAAGAFFWYQRRVLAQLTEPV